VAKKAGLPAAAALFFKKGADLIVALAGAVAWFRKFLKRKDV